MLSVHSYSVTELLLVCTCFSYVFAIATNHLFLLCIRHCNQPSVFSTIKTTFEALSENKVVGMKDYKLIQSRKQPANLKKILTKAEFSSKPPMVTKCGDKRCECCNHLLLSDHYVLKEVNYKFTLKSPMSCGSCNLIYVVVCFGCMANT